MRIVMQPARRSEKVVNKHYEDTIAKPVDFDQHAHLLEPEVIVQLKELFPKGAAQMWGVVPGKKNVNVSRIKKMSPGDWVFFTGDNKVYFGGTIALMWHNRPLAEHLWDTDDNGSTWEYMYALSGTRGFDIPISEVRQLLGWKQTRNIMGISVLNDADSEALQTLLTLDAAPATPAAPLDPQQEQEAVDAFDGELERKAQRAQRGEQAALKRRLLPGNTGECALCGRTLPGAFLIGAHIKKRAFCEESEKRDLANIAMLACTFGCDAVYEHGYVTVDPAGALRVSPLAADSPEVATYIREKLEGRTISWWNANREPYYQWHRTHTFKDVPSA
ncbi:hypothetical protein C0R01_23895 [Streptomyces albidoflavus]|nr:MULTISPECIES: hypothetical protein [Streptomyces]MBV7652601.1 hypothetical protein [Streptomyces albidoflavus]MBV7714070.1 hypothetical protein [Streptomyces albidoflavus]MCX4468477.1 hypothetical protein [Streptomyces albidoflavus]RZE54773.1 hypothetical protein C0R00_31535 [Streptomyces albidoflavus]RZE56368.1 hypothetical protein C0Q98_19425 [Streptomyces albidoflavus]